MATALLHGGAGIFHWEISSAAKQKMGITHMNMYEQIIAQPWQRRQVFKEECSEYLIELQKHVQNAYMYRGRKTKSKYIDMHVLFIFHVFPCSFIMFLDFVVFFQELENVRPHWAQGGGPNPQLLNS